MGISWDLWDETNSKFAPENGWLEYDPASFWGKFGLFSGAFAVSFREGIGFKMFLVGLGIVMFSKRHCVWRFMCITPKTGSHLRLLPCWFQGRYIHGFQGGYIHVSVSSFLDELM